VITTSIPPVRLLTITTSERESSYDPDPEKRHDQRAGRGGCYKERTRESGGGHKSWIVDFVNGTDRYQFGMIQRYWQPMHAQQSAGGNLLP
jgi:hypothetical protein